MPLSRVRLRIAAAFAVAFALSLGALAAVAGMYLWRQSNQRLDVRLSAIADGVLARLESELVETPDSSLAFAASEVVAEWPVNDDSFGIVDDRANLVASADRAKASSAVWSALARAGRADRFRFANGDQDYRAASIPPVTFSAAHHEWKFGIVAYASTQAIESDIELLVGALALAAPLIIVLSLTAGYVMARRALRPVNELREAIAATAPGDLTHRLTIAAHDEIGALGAEFNSLLARLDEAQQRNRGFVREAAHQIRTPLTLVLGEAGNALTKSGAPAEETHAVLARIQMAAQQMQRRVNELSLLADAQAGVVVNLDESVELDGLVLECTDLMRARVTALGRALAIGRADHAVVRANAPLLREALMELIENAARHGTSVAPITVSSHDDGGSASVVVESAGEPFSLQNDAGPPEGLGMPIVAWIARAHGAELSVSRDGATNVVALRGLKQAKQPMAGS